MSSLAGPKYRADIDGLRAIAILSVLAYHAFPQAVPGGFIGVDVFFVISGYLISSIILGSLAKGHFSFTEFYARRIKRIFPALALVLAACYAAGWYMLMPQEFKRLGEHVAGGAGFISNIMLWREAGYFDASAEVKPLLHLWSLGIEEQFYIAWPLLLYFSWKKRSTLAWLMAALIVISFLFNVYKTQTDIVAAFYSPITRFWELTMGSGLAYLTLFQNRSLESARRRLGELRVLGARLTAIGAATGLLAIGAAAAFLNTHKAFPGWWALLPTLGTVFLIFTGPDTWVSRNILSNRPMVFVGLISFPLYLWHWPLLVFTRIAGSGSVSLNARMAVVSASFVLATLTYVLVEKSIRKGAYNFAKVFCLVTLMSGVGYAGYHAYSRGGLNSRVGGLISPLGRIEQTSALSHLSVDHQKSADAGKRADGEHLSDQTTLIMKATAKETPKGIAGSDDESNGVRVRARPDGGSPDLPIVTKGASYETPKENIGPKQDTAELDSESVQLIGAYASLNYDYATDARRRICWLNETDAPDAFSEECVDKRTADAKPVPLMLIWGDSHAARLFPGIRKVFGEQYRLAQFTRDSCVPIPVDFRGVYGTLCKQTNSFVIDKIRQIRPDIVILYALWGDYGKWSQGEEAPEKLLRTIAEMRSAGVARVIVIGPGPRWKIGLPSNLLEIFQNNVPHRVPLRTSVGLNPTVQPVDAEFARLFGSQDYAIYVSAFKEFCTEEGCLTRVNGEASGLTTWDYGHLTTSGAEYLARKIPVNRRN